MSGGGSARVKQSVKNAPNPPPSQMELSPVNTAAPPPGLKQFSPGTGPKSAKVKCPHGGKGKKGPGPKKPPPGRPKKPCDVQGIRIQVKEPGATDQAAKPVVFDTISASAGRPNQRPRDLSVAASVPPRIRTDLNVHDLVIEVVAPPAAAASAQAGGAKSGSQHSVKMTQAKVKTKAAGPPATLIAAAAWDAQCGDANHAVATLLEDDGTQLAKGASITKTIESKSKSEVSDLWDFVIGGLDVRKLGRRYHVKAGSCGVSAKGPPTTNLSALITAYPAGSSGIKIAWEGLAFSFGWTAADKYASDYIKRNENRLDATTSAALERRLDRAESNGARLAEKRPKGGKKIADKHKRNLKTNRQEIAELKNLLDAKQESEKSPFSFTAVLFDEEIDLGETYRKAKEAVTTVKRAQKTIEGVMSCLKFLTEYSPSLITPVAKIDIAFLQTETFVGMRLSSGGALQEPRWRAVPWAFDIEVNVKALEINGSFGAVVGKRVLGTGASIEVLFSPSVSIAVGATYSSPNIQTMGLASWEKTKIAPQGNFSASGKLSGKVTFLYFHLATAEAAANGSGRISTDCELGDIVGGRGKFVWTLTLDPVGGYVEAYLIGFKKPSRYDYQLWQGGVWDFNV